MKKVRLTERQIKYCIKKTQLNEQGSVEVSVGAGTSPSQVQSISNAVEHAAGDNVNVNYTSQPTRNTMSSEEAQQLSKDATNESVKSYTKKQVKQMRSNVLKEHSTAYTKKNFAKKFINENIEDIESEVSVWSFDANKFNQVTALKALFTNGIENAIEKKGGYETMVIPEYWKQLDSNNGLTLYYDPQNEVYRFVKNENAVGNDALASALGNVPNPETTEGKASSMVAKWSINAEQFSQTKAMNALFNPELLDIIEKKGGFVEQQVPSEWKPLDACDGIRMYYDPFEKAYKFVQEEGNEGNEDIKNFFRNR